jgi:AraC family transcriptional regulator
MPTRWKIDGNLGFLSVHVARERVRTLLYRDGLGAAELRDLVFRFAVRDPYLTAASRELARELRAPTEAGSLYADLLADSMILRVLRLGNPGRGAESGRPRRLSSRQLETARARIEASLELGVSLAELAGDVGLSRFHFARAFKASTGMPPHRYMTMRRIERAKGLLRDPEKPLVEVALEAGFSSQSHFTGRFREITGTTPLIYRNERP